MKCPKCKKEIKVLDREDFIVEMTNWDYEYMDIVEFAETMLQNLNSLEENVEDFKRWVKLVNEE